MKNFENYFKKEKWMGILFLIGVLLVISFPSYAGSIREVSRNMKQVQFIEPPFQFALIGDSRSAKIEGEVVDIEGQIRDKFVIE